MVIPRAPTILTSVIPVNAGQAIWQKAAVIVTPTFHIQTSSEARYSRNTRLIQPAVEHTSP